MAGPEVDALETQPEAEEPTSGEENSFKVLLSARCSPAGHKGGGLVCGGGGAVSRCGGVEGLTAVGCGLWWLCRGVGGS
jgi:hypothetical protein